MSRCVVHRFPRLVARLGLAAAVLLGAAITTAGPASADAVRERQWYLGALGFDRAWQTTRGQGATACVVDSGVDTRVPDLRGAVAASTIFDPYPTSAGLISDHGTGVASVLAGRGHGSGHASGVIGVAPQATLLSALANENSDYPGAAAADAQVASAVRWCADHGAGVVNASFAVADPDGRIAAAVRYAQGKDVVVVAATGNTFQDIPQDVLSAPARLPGVVAVTGINRSLAHDAGAVTSSRGKAVSISAPNTATDGRTGTPQIGLPVAGDSDDRRRGEPYLLQADGTSYAAPIVAGTVALIRAAAPGLTATQVVHVLLDSATPAGGDVPNRTYGHGIVDPAGAVAAARRLAGASSAPTSSADNAPPVDKAEPTGSTSVTAASVAGGAAALVVLIVGVALLARRRRRGGRETYRA